MSLSARDYVNTDIEVTKSLNVNGTGRELTEEELAEIQLEDQRYDDRENIYRRKR